MFEHGLNVSWGVVVMWVAGGLTIALIGGGWWLDETHMGLAGLACSVISASLTVIKDNSKTRRVVRSVVREEHQERVRAL